MSSFAVLFGSGCERSMITLTGFDHRGFRHLLSKFSTLYTSFSPYSIDGTIRLLPIASKRRGRPRSMTPTQSLALFLAWYRTRGSLMQLCLTFGITASVASLYIRFARRLVLKVLAGDELAKVRMPTENEIEAYKETFSRKYSLLGDVYCVADGLKLHLEQSKDFIIQNMYYNGWTHDHYVGNVIVFAPSGLIIACAYNAPGSFHDSLIAEWGNVYEKLEKWYDETGGRCVVDSAFAKGTYPFLIKSAQDPLLAGDDVTSVIRFQQATSARQASEWGMRAFQGSFPRMKDRFVYEEKGERKLMLLSTILLFNLRTRLVGINQILNSYMPHLGVEANLFLRDTLNL